MSDDKSSYEDSSEGEAADVNVPTGQFLLEEEKALELWFWPQLIIIMIMIRKATS